MPVVIGSKRESDFTDPIGMLSDCHRRIERFLRVLLTIATEQQGGPLSGEQKAAFDAALNYFRNAAPQHTADEEESLFPRLRRIESAEMQSTLEQIDALEHDHERADASHQEVERLGREWLKRGQLPGEDAKRLASLLAELSELYEHHIALEDREIFPCANRLLSPEDRTAVGAEMAGRRGITASRTAVRRS
ncbi:MAG TPA: hemerythrin domain-containing protein [Bryobacteraceae bacterium]|jgi:hemerythrin-like domain-containing protein